MASILNPTVGERLLVWLPPIHPADNNQAVLSLFESDTSLNSIAVVENERPVGLINRYTLVDSFARPFRHELYGRKPCTVFMDKDPLIVEHTTTIQALSRKIVDGPHRNLASGFIITKDGYYLGLGSIHALIREITEMQIHAARYANPLTQLPGNVPINERIDELLHMDREFNVCYCDLDHFKPFNDVYGFNHGDRIIKLTAEILLDFSDPDQDFVGHIGGDDFIIIFLSPDWNTRCQGILNTFDERVKDFFSIEDRDRGGYLAESRTGSTEFHPLTSLSIGAVRVTSKIFDSHREVARVASEIKKMAKRISGSSLVSNHRQYQESVGKSTPTEDT